MNKKETYQDLLTENRKLVATEKKLNKNMQALVKRVKELECIYKISRVIRTRESIEDVLMETVGIIQEAWQYPEITCVRIRNEGKEFVSKNFKESKWKQSADIVVGGETKGSIEVFYTEERPGRDEGPFLKEERKLINGISEYLGQTIEHKTTLHELNAANQQLNAANQQLLASEQQLRAAIQQLKAGEQQLRANNQELAASEQQLRAANQQLLSSQQELQAAKENAESNEKYYHTILNNMGDPVFVKDEQSRLLLVNDAFCELFDLQRVDIIGKTLAEDVAPEELESFLRIDKEVFTTGKESINEESLTIRGGKTLTISTRKTRFENVSGEKYLVGVIRDITERMHAENAIKTKNEEYKAINKELTIAKEKAEESEEKFKTIFNMSQSLVCIADINTSTFKFINPSFERILGYTEEELLSKPFTEFIHPDDVEPTKEVVEKQLQAGKAVHTFENRYLCKNGDYCWLNWDSYPIPEKGITYAIAHDVSDLKKAQQELINAKDKAEESNANVTAIIEGTNSSIWAFDKEYKIIYINQKFQQEFSRSFGVNLKPGMNLVEALPESLQPIWKPRYDRVLANEHFKIEDAVPTDIGTLYIEVTFNPIIKNDQVIGISCFGSDITSRKRAEIELMSAKEKAEKSEEKLLRNQYYLNKAQEIGNVGSWELDLIKNKLIWSDQNYINFGVPIGTPLTYEVFIECVHPDDREFVNTEWMAAIDGEPYDIEHRILVNSEVRWVREKAEIVFDDGGNAIRAIGFTQDITNKKSVEEELKNYQKNLEKLVNERTRELEEKNEELERFNNLFVGREFRIKELKDKVKELEAQLSGNDVQ